MGDADIFCITEVTPGEFLYEDVARKSRYQLSPECSPKKIKGLEVG